MHQVKQVGEDVRCSQSVGTQCNLLPTLGSHLTSTVEQDSDDSYADNDDEASDSEWHFSAADNNDDNSNSDSDDCVVFNDFLLDNDSAP